MKSPLALEMDRARKAEVRARAAESRAERLEKDRDKWKAEAERCERNSRAYSLALTHLIEDTEEIRAALDLLKSLLPSQPASSARTQEEADAWAKLYTMVNAIETKKTGT